MRAPRLPDTVRITPDNYFEWSKDTEGNPVRGEKKPGAPTYIFRPIGVLKSAAYGKGLRDNSSQACAQAALEHLKGVEDLTVGDEGSDEAFDAKNPDHVEALEPADMIFCGDVLLARTYLSEKDRGK